MAQHSSTSKVAVVLIHGMGEQHPMDTLRGFVRGVWHPDSQLFGADKSDAYRTWSKPDAASRSAELRRITTSRTPPRPDQDRGVRVDFFELYWADITADSTWRDFAKWFGRLLWRCPWKSLPKRVIQVWGLLWVLTLGVIYAPLWALNYAASHPDKLWWCAAAVVLAACVLLAGKSFLVRYFGDVARYVTPSPRNVRIRHAARRRGLELIEALHTHPEYERIVVVGHSLGSILAHDILALAWQDAVQGIDMSVPARAAALASCEAAAAELDRCAAKDGTAYAGALASYRLAQRELFRVLSTGANRWCVSDLITVGSPLTHAEVLLAEGAEQLKTKIDERELLRSPPVKDGDPASFAYSPSSGRGQRFMHHAATMAATRWTNLHDQPLSPACFLRGDVISGPLAGLFGPGVLDIAVQPVNVAWWRPGRCFTHSSYWTLHSPDTADDRNNSLRALRAAMNLRDDAAVESQLLDLLSRH